MTAQIETLSKESLVPEMQADPLGGKTLHQKAAAFRACAEVKDRKHRLRTYKKCFVACDVVDSLLEKGTCSTREEAVQLGQQLCQELGLFENVFNEQEFKDEYLFFRFWYHREESEDGKEASMVTNKLLQGAIKVKKAASKVANKTVSNLKESLKGELSEHSQAKDVEEATEETSQSTETPTELNSSEQSLGFSVDTADVVDFSKRTSTRQRRQISRGANAPQSEVRSAHRSSKRSSNNPNKVSCRRSRVRRHRSKSLDSKPQRGAPKKDIVGIHPIQRQRSNSFSGPESASGLQRQEEEVTTKSSRTRSNSADPSSRDNNSFSCEESISGLRSKEEAGGKQSRRTSTSAGSSSRHGSSDKDATCKTRSTKSMRRSTSLQVDAHGSATKRQSTSNRRSPKRKSAMAVLSATNGNSKEVQMLFKESKVSSSIQEDEASNICQETTVVCDKELVNSERAEETEPKQRASTKTLEGISHFASQAISPTSAHGWDCSCCGGKNLSSTHSFCGMCGTRKQEQQLLWECNSCGTKDNQGRYQFCGGCGCTRSSGSRGCVSPMPLAA